jgi:hypothetical protein
VLTHQRPPQTCRARDFTGARPRCGRQTHKLCVVLSTLPLTHHQNCADGIARKKKSRTRWLTHVPIDPTLPVVPLLILL